MLFKISVAVNNIDPIFHSFPCPLFRDDNHFGDPLSQVVMWRIHKSKVYKLDQSVIEVSDRGGVERSGVGIYFVSV